MTEIIDVALFSETSGPVPFGLQARAVHSGAPDAHWEVFVAGDDADYWVAAMEFLAIPELITVSNETARFLCNLAQLLGDPWETVTDDFAACLAQQAAALDRMGDKTKAGLRHADPFDVREWRLQMEKAAPTDGEILREQVAGVQPFAGRN